MVSIGRRVVGQEFLEISFFAIAHARLALGELGLVAVEGFGAAE